MNTSYKMKTLVSIALFSLMFSLIGCATPPTKTDEGTTLTYGEVKRQITKGVTTQAEVLNVFGSPNLVSKNKEDKEVWAYNRMSYETASGAGGASLIIIGGSRAVSSSTTKSFDLIITFDKNSVVEDYKVIQASY